MSRGLEEGADGTLLLLIVAKKASRLPCLLLRLEKAICLREAVIRTGENVGSRWLETSRLLILTLEHAEAGCLLHLIVAIEALVPLILPLHAKAGVLLALSLKAEARLLLILTREAKPRGLLVLALKIESLTLLV